jgi:putative spermidine/putrescine transport system substrate-binding protein
MTIARTASATVSALALLAAAVPASAQSMDELVAADKAEGALSTIALPHDWCGYGDIIEAFKAKYPGIEVNELNPDAGSADELEAIRANKGNTGPQAPDVIDVGLSFGPAGQKEGLLMPYKVATWDTIPSDAKDADGNWYGDYYGVLTFEVNSDIVAKAPDDWSALLDPAYKNAVALGGDPRASNQAIQGVYAAGLGAGGAAGADAGEAGLKFFADLNKAGNFVPVIGKAASLAQGSTPIIIRWDYLALADRDTLGGNPPVDVVVPKTGVDAGVYIQAISAYAPHPNAAKLWIEYLYSDEGQLGFLKGYCHPIRFNDLAKNGKIPQDLLDKLPPAAAYEHAVFPTLADQGAAKDVITQKWDQVVGANVQ